MINAFAVAFSAVALFFIFLAARAACDGSEHELRVSSLGRSCFAGGVLLLYLGEKGLQRACSRYVIAVASAAWNKISKFRCGSLLDCELHKSGQHS